MNKGDAVLNIVRDARSERGSRTSMLRLEKSLRTLGLSEFEITRCMGYMDYWNSDGEPYPRYLKSAP